MRFTHRMFTPQPAGLPATDETLWALVERHDLTLLGLGPSLGCWQQLICLASECSLEARQGGHQDVQLAGLDLLDGPRVDAHHRGVKVTVILDKSQSVERQLPFPATTSTPSPSQVSSVS